MRNISPAATLLVLAACASGGNSTPAGPPAVAYDDLPERVTYVQGDTIKVSVDAGGQLVDVDVRSRATMDLSIAPADGGTRRVTLTWTDLEASASNPMAPPTRADEGDVDGPLVFDLSRTGRTSFVSGPELRGEAAATFVSPRVTAAGMLPRVPGRALEPGDLWVDTVSVRADEDGTVLDATTITHYRVRGDTTVMGRTYLMVTSRSEVEQSVEMNQMGQDVIQEMSGTSTGWFLWDRELHLPYEIVGNSELTGTMEMSSMPMALPVQARSRSRTVLQAGM